MTLGDAGRAASREILDSVRDVGGFIRTQRQNAEMSLRSLAERAGISNPYLSQVERGLRRPSAAILARIADELSISAESLLTKAGILRGDTPTSSTVDAIRADLALTERQKLSLLEIYRAFTADTAATTTTTETTKESL